MERGFGIRHCSMSWVVSYRARIINPCFRVFASSKTLKTQAFRWSVEVVGAGGMGRGRRIRKNGGQGMGGGQNGKQTKQASRQETSEHINTNKTAT